MTRASVKDVATFQDAGLLAQLGHVEVVMLWYEDIVNSLRLGNMPAVGEGMRVTRMSH